MSDSNALIPKPDVDITSLALSQLELELLNKTNNLTTDSIIELQKIKTQNRILELLQNEDNRKQQIFEYQINNINLHKCARLLVVFRFRGSSFSCTNGT